MCTRPNEPTLPIPAAAGRGEPHLLIVVPPFATAAYPMLGPSILKAACIALGLQCSVAYPNVLLAGLMGPDRYEGIAAAGPTDLEGERLFSPLAFRHGAVADAGFAAAAEQMFSAFRTLLRRVRPVIVGFSSTFQQNAASVALARIVKDEFPSALTVLGGANAEVPMGEALEGLARCFDVVFSGEADEAFPAFCASHLRGTPLPKTRVVVCDPIARLDCVPIPDFDDYFATLEAVVDIAAWPTAFPASLPFETSRGCWWGQKNHCAFCGLNARGMTYRAKSVERICAEVDTLVRRHGQTRMHATDNIMPLDFHRTALPQLAGQGLGVNFFYEVKSSLRPEELDMLVMAGVSSVQPGIESLSTPLLRLMRKGGNGPLNIALLRECASRQIDVNWNMLAGVPGDRLHDYEGVLAILPYIEHLQPPSGCTPVVIDRYSPYFTNPGAFAVSAIRPVADYSDVYPSGADLGNLAYHFDADYPSEYRRDPAFAARFARAIDSWKAAWNGISGRRAVLVAITLESGRIVVFDTRSVASQREYILAPEEASALSHFDRPRPAHAADGALRDVVAGLTARGLIVPLEGCLLNVAVTPEIGDRLRADIIMPTTDREKFHA